MATIQIIIERYIWVIPFVANCIYSYKNYDDIRKTDLLRYYDLNVKRDSNAILIYQLGLSNIPFLFVGLGIFVEGVPNFLSYFQLPTEFICVRLFHVSILALSLLLVYWVHQKGGDDFISRYRLMVERSFFEEKDLSPSYIRIHVIGLAVVIAILEYLLWS